MSATNIDNPKKIDLDEFFKPKIDEALEAINSDRSLVEEFYGSDLTVVEFAKRKHMGRMQITRLLNKYNLPPKLIDSETVRRVKNRARKTRRLILTDHCNCIAAQLLRQEFDRQDRRANISAQ